MSITLCMIVKDEADILPSTIPTYLPLIDSWTILDTGSADGTQQIAAELLGHLPGRLHEAEWADFSTARTQALELARGRDQWILMPDADMTCEAHPDLKTWLMGEPDPAVDAWQVEIVDSGTRWRRPMLLRGGERWEFKGKAHEYLDTTGRYCRALLGLVLHHDSSGPTEGKYDRYADLLREDAEAGEPRSVFYYAESLRFAGRSDEALEWYRRRAEIASGYDEERWYAAYMVGRLSDDVEALVACWEMRPWRHEPLTAAARITANRGARNDMLFLEDTP